MVSQGEPPPRVFCREVVGWFSMMIKKKETNCMLAAGEGALFSFGCFSFVFHTCFLRGIEPTVLPKLDK